MINTQVFVFAVSKSQAMRLLADNNLNADPASAFDKLKDLVHLHQAESLANPSVTSREGQRAISDNGTVRLEAEPLTESPGDVINVNVVLQYKATRLLTALLSHSGDIRFFGSVDLPDQKLTGLAFLVVRASEPIPPLESMFKVTVARDHDANHISGAALNGLIPIVLTLKNLSGATIYVAVVQGRCQYTLSSVDGSGRTEEVDRVSFLGGISGPPWTEIGWVDLAPGVVRNFQTDITRNYRKFKKLVIAIPVDAGEFAPPYAPFTAPFSPSDLN